MVTSGKGGVGKSSVTAGVGAALARQGKKVLLFDADVALRSLDIILGTADGTVYNWFDLMTGACDIEQAVVQVEDAKELYVLSAPVKRCTVRLEDFWNLFKKLREEYDYIFIDSPAGVGQGFELSMIPADIALVVATTDPVCLRAANTVVRILLNKGIGERKLIINRFKARPIGKKKLPNVDDTIDGTGAQLIGIVPNDDRITYFGAKGKPLPEKISPALAFNRIAKRLEGEEIPLKHLERM